MLRTVAIIGVGSPLGADRLGWQAVEQLERSEFGRRFPQLTLRFEQADRPGALLLELLRGADAAIIIDALQAGLPTGTLRAFTLQQVLAQETGLLSSHAFGVAEALALGTALGELPMPITIIGIEMGHARERARLAEPALSELLQLAEALLHSFGKTEALRSGMPCAEQNYPA